MKPIIVTERHQEASGTCWQMGVGTAKRNWAVHVSFGPPAWWLPNVGRKRYSGITEWRFGWLLMAVQIAVKPNPQAQGGHT
jgi:hypothetical protein